MQYSGITLSPGFVITAATDPQFNYVTALLHGDGTNAGQNNTFLDSSPNNFTITRNGSTTQGSLAPYSTLWSNFLNTGDKLTASASSAFDLSGSTWTIEFWMYSLATPTSGNQCRMLMAGSNGDAAGWDISYDNTGYLGFYRPYGGGPVGIATPASTIALNTWYHVAFVCNAGSARIYINGVSVAGPVTITLPTSASQTLRIGYDDVGTVNFQYNGYISNLRIVKGTAVYTSNFTPPTTPLTAITNTSFLSCQSNRFKDNSTNNLTITPTATPSVQRYSPFGTTTQYDPATIGGSAYFGTTTDYLTVPSSSNFAFGTGDFTVEAWLYPTSAPNAGGTFFIVGSTTNGFIFGYQNATSWGAASNGGSWFITSTTLPTLNAWNYIAITRSSGTAYLFLNGTLLTSAASAQNFPAMSTYIGHPSTNLSVNGYLSNLRALQGTALYTTSNTPPTTPLTAITNTALLLNFTNGQIYDNAMMSNFVTVGSAQISTSIFKYGTGSIALNGSTDYLSTPASPNFAFGSGDFTVEAWLYRTGGGTSTGSVVLNQSITGATSNTAFYFGAGNDGMALYLSTTGTSWTNSITTGVATTLSTWSHVVWQRRSNVLEIYLNGVLQTVTGGTAAFSGTIFTSTRTVEIGTQNAAGSWFTGNIDELRVTKGYARYTANFTAPTSQFPSTGDITPGVLNYLVVGGGGGGGVNTASGGGAGGLVTSTSGFAVGSTYTVTVGAGATAVSSASPGTGVNGGTGTSSSVTFNNPITYAASFNGSTQYLTTNYSLNWSTLGSYTLEFWVYLPSLAANQTFFSTGPGTSGYTVFYVYSTGSVGVGINGTNEIVTATGAVVAGQWTHIAYTYNATTTTIYVNGVSKITGTTAVYANNSGNFVIAGSNSTGSVTGYLSNIRLSKLVVYTANFTPPLSPLTSTQLVNVNGAGSAAITGTQTALLTLQNATIVDNSTNAYTITNSGSVTTSQTISPLDTVVAYGGGGGSSGGTGGTTIGGNGGSGGGGNGTAGAGTTGQGFFGYSDGFSGGGGAGATGGAPGGTGPTSYTGGSGGIGATTTIITTAQATSATVGQVVGSSVYFAGGGGGSGDYRNRTGGVGGYGGGGTGSNVQGAAGGSGTVNTGGGGAGSSYSTSSQGNGGAGGSGVVILSYPATLPTAASTTGSPTIYTTGGYNTYIFKSSGSITF